MRVIINCSATTLYTQTELDAAVEKARKDSRGVTGKDLREAWRRYAQQFPAMPSVSEKQLTAILALVRERG